jgi:hypothetical protein
VNVGGIFWLIGDSVGPGVGLLCYKNDKKKKKKKKSSQSGEHICDCVENQNDRNKLTVLEEVLGQV